MENWIEVRHVSLEIAADFDSFTQRFEQLLGRFDYALYHALDADPQAVEKRLKESEGAEGLMLFNIQDHGKLLGIFGNPRKAKQYILGNPLIAITMTRHDIRAGLYAPLRVLVYETDSHSTRVDFDQPSSLFGQFNNPEVTAVALSIDMKLANLIRKADLIEAEPRADSA
jgi:uncharacterized protein (DUF302 family)